MFGEIRGARIRFDFRSENTLARERCVWASKTRCFIMVLAFEICETITKQRLFERHLTPMLGEDRFFDEKFMWFGTIFVGIMLWQWSCSFPPFCPLFYYVCSWNVGVATGFPSKYRSHAARHSFLRCFFSLFSTIVFSMKFLIDFRIYQKGFENTNENGLEELSTLENPSLLGHD